MIYHVSPDSFARLENRCMSISILQSESASTGMLYRQRRPAQYRRALDSQTSGYNHQFRSDHHNKHDNSVLLSLGARCLREP